MATRGVDIQLKVGTTFLGGQRGATLNQSTETIETTSKSTGGWKEFVSSFREWSIDCDGLLPDTDTSFTALKTAYNAGTTIEVSLVDADGDGYKGNVIITDFPLEYPYDDTATYSVTLQGTGALVAVTAGV